MTTATYNQIAEASGNMATNVTQKDKTLNEIIDWCTEWAKQICDAREGDAYIDYIQVVTLEQVIDHCKHMLGYSWSMPLEVPNQAEDTNMKTVDR